MPHADPIRDLCQRLSAARFATDVLDAAIEAVLPDLKQKSPADAKSLEYLLKRLCEIRPDVAQLLDRLERRSNADHWLRDQERGQGA